MCYRFLVNKDVCGVNSYYILMLTLSLYYAKLLFFYNLSIYHLQ